MLEDLPSGTERIDVYGFDGLRATVNVQGKSDIHIQSLAPEQTYMFVGYRNTLKQGRP